MKTFREDIKKIYDEEKGVLVLMILNCLFGLFLVVLSIIKMAETGTVVKVGYSDLSGYENGRTIDLAVYLILGFCFAILHDFLAVKIFHKRGRMMASFFLVVSMLLSVAAGIVLGRLTS